MNNSSLRRTPYNPTIGLPRVMSELMMVFVKFGYDYVPGMMVGGYVWGSMADRVGRRSVLLGSLTVNGLFGLASSTAQVFWLFLLFRFLSGVG